MQLKLVGNFQELPHGDPAGPSLKACIASTPQIHEEQILHYLRHGLVLAACAGPARDVLAPITKLIDAPNLMTDGVWGWYGDLTYYVREYHCRLPEEFVQYMQEHYWQPPREEDVNLLELERLIWPQE